MSFTGKVRRPLLPLLVAAILGAAALTGYQIWSGHRAVVAEAGMTTRNFAWMLAANLDSTLRRVDAGLGEIAATLPPVAAAAPDPAGRIQAMLDLKLRDFPELAGIRIFDAGGDMRHTSTGVAALRIRVGDRAYFARLRDDPQAGLVFSEALTSRATGRPAIVVGRALREGGGRFAGAVTAEIELDHFQRLFATLDIGRQGVLAIRRSDNLALVLRRPPAATGESGSLPSRHPLAEALAAGQRMATVRVPTHVDGVDRIVSVRVLERYPYFVVAGLGADEALARWRARSVSVAGLALLLLGFVGIVLARLVVAERDSERIVGELAESSRHLLEHDARLNEALDIARAADWSYDVAADRFEFGHRVPGLLRCEDAAALKNLSAAAFRERLVHPDDAPQVDALLARANVAPTAGRTWEEALRLRCGDGVARWMLLRFQQASGEAAGPRLNGTLIDIHERREAATALRDLSAMQSAILEAADYSIISTTPEGVITSFNHAAERMLGYGAEEVIGRVTPAVIHDAAEVAARAAEFSTELGEAIAPGFEVFVARSRRHLPNSYEWTYVRKDGSRFPVLLSVTALRDRDGAITGFLGIAADITEWRRATQALRESEAALNAAQAVAHIGSWTLDIPGNRLGWSDETYRLFGVERGTPLTYELFLDGVHPDDRAAVAAAWNAAMAGAPYDIEHRLRGDGEARWVRERAEIAFDAAGKPVSGVGTVQDITERKAAEQRLRLLAVAFQHSGEALLITDRDNHILEVNPAFTRFTGYSLDEVRGRNPRVLSAGRTTPDTYRAMWQGILGTGYWQGEVWDRRKDGGIYPKLLTITAVRDATGTITHHVGSFADITAQKATEERIRHLALHDALTGLPNRLDLQGRLQQSLAAARRDQQQVAVMLLDLDRFKPINDRLGHMAGDALLIEVSRRLKSAVRDSDIVARLGGDEFVVVLPGVPGRAAAGHMADKLIAAIDEPYRLDGHDVTVSPSIGIALFPADGDDDETLLRRADEAMYRAKSRGRDNWQFYAG